MGTRLVKRKKITKKNGLILKFGDKKYEVDEDGGAIVLNEDEQIGLIFAYAMMVAPKMEIKIRDEVPGKEIYEQILSGEVDADEDLREEAEEYQRTCDTVGCQVIKDFGGITVEFLAGTYSFEYVHDGTYIKELVWKLEKEHKILLSEISIDRLYLSDGITEHEFKMNTTSSSLIVSMYKNNYEINEFKPALELLTSLRALENPEAHRYERIAKALEKASSRRRSYMESLIVSNPYTNELLMNMPDEVVQAMKEYCIESKSYGIVTTTN